MCGADMASIYPSGARRRAVARANSPVGVNPLTGGRDRLGGALVQPLSGQPERQHSRAPSRPEPGMDDLHSHFYFAVGQLLDQAAVGRLRVRVELSDGGAAAGVPSRAEERSDTELDDTGYPQLVRVGDHVVPLEHVRRATIVHPDGEERDDEH